MHRYCVQSFQDIDDTQCITNSGLVLCFALYLSSFRLAFFRLVVFSPGVFSIFRLFAWRRFVISSFCLASFCYFIISPSDFSLFQSFRPTSFRYFGFLHDVFSSGVMAKRRNNARRNDKKRHAKRRNNATRKDEK